MLICKVISVGTGVTLPNGTHLLPQLKVGDKVLAKSWAGEKMEEDYGTFYFMLESDILGILS